MLGEADDVIDLVSVTEDDCVSLALWEGVADVDGECVEDGVMVTEGVPLREGVLEVLGVNDGVMGAEGDEDGAGDMEGVWVGQEPPAQVGL